MTTTLERTHLGKVNRGTVPPFLLQVYVKAGEYHQLHEFQNDQIPETEKLTLYTWMDCSVEELYGLVLKEKPETANQTIRFSLVFKDKLKNDGSLRSVRMALYNPRIPHVRSKKLNLADLKFRIGDYVAVAVGGDVGDGGDGKGREDERSKEPRSSRSGERSERFLPRNEDLAAQSNKNEMKRPGVVDENEDHQVTRATLNRRVEDQDLGHMDAQRMFNVRGSSNNNWSDNGQENQADFRPRGNNLRRRW
ncbi:Sin3 associated polypeptide p18-domain-containing protein [Lipomyces japonicus]|uniref:Sin3 associated polypeptide p18-domain-containing protein n=1 Tax=Lipomyces japonicus TaxID=56871 RepID=UPI0034CFAA12